MCGIIGYVGKKSSAPILLEGLRRLEYRGYDSAGVAVLEENGLQLRKKKGRIDVGLAPLLEEQPIDGSVGIGHTRWATHGIPSDANSHPHLDQSGRIAVVHNGVIENCDRLREKLKQTGHKFRSDTDTEVLAHLIGDCCEKLTHGKQNGNRSTKHASGCGSNGVHPLTRAVCEALEEVAGTYGIAVISSRHPGTIVGARRGSPLIVGIGESESFLASDANAIVPHTREVVYLNDNDVVTLTSDRLDVLNGGLEKTEVRVSQLEFSSEDAALGEFPHFMLKEIFEQPRAVANALRGRMDGEGANVVFDGLERISDCLKSVERVIIAASGTSWHAALVGEYLLEDLARLPVDVQFAHEYCYRNAPVESATLVLVISQSGETADTLAALREAQTRGHHTLAIVNVPGSTVARESEGVIYMRAGPEIGVASTKAFVSTITVLAMVAVHLGRMRALSSRRAAEVLRALEGVPGQIHALLEQSESVKGLALKHVSAKDFFYMGRGYTFPLALEGALKLKEISYIHAEGYSSAEMKHGPIALIDSRTPTVFLAPRDSMHEKSMANLAMIRARKGPIIALATEGDPMIGKQSDDVLWLPAAIAAVNPILAAVPLQLFAYHLAVARGCDVDKPRNLAKSVTVE